MKKISFMDEVKAEIQYRLDRLYPQLSSIEDRLLLFAKLISELERKLESCSKRPTPEYLIWRCEACGKKSEIPALLVRHIRWYCQHCGIAPFPDIQELYTSRFDEDTRRSHEERAREKR